MKQNDPHHIQLQLLELEKAIQENDTDTIKQLLEWFESVNWSHQQFFLKRDFDNAKAKLVFTLDSVKEETKTEHVEEVDKNPKAEGESILTGPEETEEKEHSPVEIGSSTGPVEKVKIKVKSTKKATKKPAKKKKK